MSKIDDGGPAVFIPLVAIGVFWFILKMSEDQSAPPPLDDFEPTWEDDPRYPGWRRK